MNLFPLYHVYLSRWNKLTIRVLNKVRESLPSTALLLWHPVSLPITPVWRMAQSVTNLPQQDFASDILSFKKPSSKSILILRNESNILSLYSKNKGCTRKTAHSLTLRIPWMTHSTTRQESSTIKLTSMQLFADFSRNCRRQLITQSTTPCGTNFSDTINNSKIGIVSFSQPMIPSDAVKPYF